MSEMRSAASRAVPILSARSLGDDDRRFAVLGGQSPQEEARIPLSRTAPHGDADAVHVIPAGGLPLGAKIVLFENVSVRQPARQAQRHPRTSRLHCENTN